MKNISYWANAHPRSARLSIFICHIALTIIGLSLGKWLECEHYSLSQSVEWITIFAAFAGIILYPFRFLYQKTEKSAYFRAKRQMDTVLVTSGFLLCIFLGNHLAEYPLNIPFPAVFAAEAHPNLLMGASPSPIFAAPAPYFFLKLAEMNVGIKVLLLILALAAAFLMGMFIVFGGCSMACSGFQTASNLFMISGIVFLPTGIIMAIHHIFGKKPPSKNGALLRKILGIVALLALLVMAGAIMYYLTVNMSMSAIVPIVLILLLVAAIFYVSLQFKPKKEVEN